MGHGAVRCNQQGLRRHRECSAGRHGIFGVHGQIQYHLIDLSSVGANGTGPRVKISGQVDVFADQPFDHGADRRKRLVEVKDLERQHLAPAEGQELPGQGRRPLAGGQDLRQRTTKRILGPHLVQHERGAPVDDGEQVVEIVGHAAGQAADPFHLVGLPELIFELFVLRDIDEESDGADRLAGRTLK